MRLPSVADSVVIADFDTELVVLVPEQRHAHLLEPLWAVLLDSCRRGDDRADLVGELAAATRWTTSDTDAWLDEALAELSRLGITAP